MIPGVDSWAVAVALLLDSVWSPWAWSLVSSSRIGNRSAVALSFVERTTNKTKEPPAKENPMSKQ